MSKEKDIIKRFNDKFPYKIAGVIYDFGDSTKDDIKQFILTELQALKEEVEKCIPENEIKRGGETEYYNGFITGHNKTIADTKQNLKEVFQKFGIK